MMIMKVYKITFEEDLKNDYKYTTSWINLKVSSDTCTVLFEMYIATKPHEKIGKCRDPVFK